MLSKIPRIWGGGRVGSCTRSCSAEDSGKVSSYKQTEVSVRDPTGMGTRAEETVPKTVQDTRVNSLRRNILDIFSSSINSFLEEYQVLCSFEMLILLTTYILKNRLEVEFLNLQK